MRRILSLLLILMLSWSAFAQKIVVTGLVVDQNNLALPGASVKLLPKENYTFSDVNGRFEFLNVGIEDSFEIVVEYLGYRPVVNQYEAKGLKSLDITIVVNETEYLDGIVVLGDRLRGQMKALNQQKNGSNISNIVSADQVGRFPDANIGDALKRIPGITMQNDQGEARNIIVRGLAPELNSVTLNGDRIPSAEGDNRKVQMDLIPSDMVQTIEVNKTLTPDMDADAIGGSVNLITRAAPNGYRISSTLSGGYNPIRSGGLYNGALVFGNRFFNNKFGMVLSGSYNKNIYGSDNVEAVWVKDDYDNVYIDEHDIRKYDVTRTRRSFSGAFDYKFNDFNSITFNAMYNWRDDWENRYRARTRGIEPIYDDMDESKIIGYEGSVRRETKGGIDNDRVKGSRLEQQTVQNYSLRGDHLIGSKMDMDWGINYSKAREYRPNERYIEFESGDLEFKPDFGSTELPLYQPVSAVSNSEYEMRTLSENTDNTYENELSARVNFRIPFSVIDGQKGRLRFGAKVRLKNKVRENRFTEYSPAGGAYATMADVSLVNWDGRNWQPDDRYVPGSFASKEFLGGLDLTNGSLFESESVPSEYLPLNYNAREQVTAGYIRWDQDFTSSFGIILGARIEHTGIDYEGNIIQDEEDLTGKRSVENAYTNFLPNLTLKYKATEDFIIRAAWTTALARPNYYMLSPFVSTILDDNEIEAGNPNLKSSYSWNYDLMAEYYFQSVGLVSAGAFYKNIDNFIYTYRDESYTGSKFATDFPDLPNPISGTDDWTLIQARNGDQVHVYGFEAAFQRQLDFLPGAFLKGFGIYTNYTFTKSEAKGIYSNDGDLREGLMLPGTAPHMFNASLSWENSRFSARLSLNHASAYLDELGGEDFDDRYYDKQTFLDFNASYRINNNFRVFFEANNLTNQPLRYYQGISSRTMQMEYYRQRYNIGVKFDLTR